jgi:cytochrome c oxidase cbb3-type subunit 3/ubiquinol-cytochrome c reductase cytochrome c subunit
MRNLTTAILACFVALSSGCAHAPGYPPEAEPRPSLVTDFATLYSQNCAACHGAGGANGPAIDLSNPEYQAIVDDNTLRKWISGGMPGTEMPAFASSAGGMLTDAQVNALIAGMRNAWSKPNVFAGATPPAYAQPQAGDSHRGQQTYAARCVVCHATLQPQQISSSDYLALVGDQALRTIIVAGRPDIGQPDWSHMGTGGKPSPPLTEQEVDDVVAYLASLRSATPQSAVSGPKSQSKPGTLGGR